MSRTFTVTKTKAKTRTQPHDTVNEDSLVNRVPVDEVEVLPYHLRMRLAREAAEENERRIKWSEDVVDNEFMNKKSSKSNALHCHKLYSEQQSH